MKKIATVEAYIKSRPKEVQPALQAMRKAIRSAAPKAEEKMGYGVAGFWLNGKPLVYYAAFKKHVGLYPGPSGIKAFKKELSAYKTATGTVQFPLDKPMPVGLVKRIVRYRVGEGGITKGKEKIIK